VRGAFVLLIVILCSSCMVKKAPPEEKNWLKIYEKELQIARENNDREAWSFFWREYLLERAKLSGYE
jgi:hypothetical protein